MDILKGNTGATSEPDPQPQKTDENSGYWEVRGSNGRILVNIEKAREAMRYAMEQHAKAREKEMGLSTNILADSLNARARSLTGQIHDLLPDLSQDNSNHRFRLVRGSKGLVRVDLDIARAAMRHTLEIHAKYFECDCEEEIS